MPPGVAANADLDSLVPRFYHDAKTPVVELFANDARSVVAQIEREGVADDLPDGVFRLPWEGPLSEGDRSPVDPATVAAAAGAAARTRTEGAAWGLASGRAPGGRAPPTRTLPPCAPVRCTTLGYHDHYVVEAESGGLFWLRS